MRRSLGQAAERKYHRGNAPASVPPEKLARVRGTRRAVEEDTQAGKGGGGLDEYQTRGWVGRHHHTALAMLAAAFLVLRKRRLGEREPQLTAPEVRALLSHLLDVRVWDIAGILKWSAWRRERNRRAAESRRKRRRAEQQPPRSKKKKPAL